MTPSLLTIKAPEWDLATCEEFFTELTPALEPAHAIVDLSHVIYIDSSCLRMIVRLQKERELRGLSPASFLLSPQLGKLFAILSFEKIWTIHSDREGVERIISAVDRRRAVNRSPHLASRAAPAHRSEDSPLPRASAS